MESAGVRQCRLRRGDAQSARVHWLWPAFYRRGQRRLGRQGLHRHHGDGDLRRDASLGRSNRMAAAGGVLRRLHDELDDGPHQSLPRLCFARRRVRSAQHGAAKPKSCGSPCGSSAACPQETPETYEHWSPSNFMPQFQHADAGDPRRTRLPRARTARACSCSPRCRRSGVPSKLLVFPDEGHWMLKPQNSQLWYHNVIDWLTEWTRPTTQ